MKVKIVDWGERYTTYDRWFKENNCEEYLDNYHMESNLIYDTLNMIFEVIKKGKHSREFNERTLYLIKEPKGDKVHLISDKGVEEV